MFIILIVLGSLIDIIQKYPVLLENNSGTLRNTKNHDGHIRSKPFHQTEESPPKNGNPFLLTDSRLLDRRSRAPIDATEHIVKPRFRTNVFFSGIFQYLHT